MKKLLITGASGFLGSRIAEYYQGRYEIVCPGHKEMDITDAEGVKRVIAGQRPDIVMHCAAVSDVGACEREPELSWKINVTGSENIVRACHSEGIKSILCSSDQVYFGSSLPGPHREEEVLTPVNSYGKQKLYAEELCQNADPDCVLLRLSWMYDTVSGREGEHGDFMRTLLQATAQEKELRYPIYDIRGITNVKEVVKNLEKAFELPGGVYNFGAPNDKSTYEVVSELLESWHYSRKKLYRNEEAFHENPRNISMSQEKCNRNGISFLSTIQGLKQA